jgi:hypothetical protein
MRKLKFAVLLPILGAIVAVVLLEWTYLAPLRFPPHGDEVYVQTPRMVCIGINAPAWPLTLLLNMLPLPGARVFVFPIDDFELLVGVIVVWYLTGSMIDDRALHQKSDLVGMAARTVLWNLLLIAWGIGLFVMAMAPLRSPRRYGNPAGNIVEGILFLAWSLVLFVFPGRHLVRVLGGRQPSPESIRR